MKKLCLSREQIVVEFAKIQYQNYLNHLPFELDEAYDCTQLFNAYLRFLNLANNMYDDYKPYLQNFISDSFIN